MKKQPIAKKRLILLAFLCLTVIFFASTASAASDVIYVNNETGNDDYDGQNDIYNSTTGSGPKLTIKNATRTVTTGGTVNIANGTYTGDGNRGITIDKDMTINGQSTAGTIIDAEQQDRIFLISPGITVTIQNLTLQNGTAGNGGAIYNVGTLTVKDSNLTKNTATSYGSNGGAIYNSGILTVTNSTFTENSATGGEFYYGGGAIYNAGSDFTVMACTFINNEAIEGGAGAIFNGGHATVTDSIFTNNKAKIIGGAICTMGGDLTVTGSTFTGNSVTTGSTSFYGGGAINNQGGDLTVTGSTFIDNTASNSGGAIYNSGNTHVNYSRFIGNTASSGSAIYNSLTSYYEVDATNNWWGSPSGPSTGSLSSRVNYVPWLGTDPGPYLVFVDSLNGDDSNDGSDPNNPKLTISNAVAHVANGGIINIADGLYTGDDNRAITINKNVTINGQSTTGTIIDAGNVYDSYGIFSIFSGYSVTIQNLTLKNGNGGGIRNSGGTLTVNSCTFTGNSAYVGGAIYSYGSLTVTGSTFTGNSAHDGGAIANHGTSTVKYCRISGNSAEQWGSALYNIDGTVNAEYNWWGSNSGPGNAIFGFGNTDTDLWLILSINADPTTINTGETSLITADVYTDSEGADHSADADQFFSGAEVTFTTDLGNVGSKSTTVDWNHGQAFVTLRGDEGPGTATVTAADGTEEVSTTVNIQSEEHKEPTTTTVSDISGHAGDSVDLVANVTAENGAIVDGGTVNFTVNGVSAGSAMVTNGQASTSWTIPSNWTAGTYEIVAEYRGTDDYEASQGQNTLTVIPSASLYLKVTSSNDSPRVGETFTLTYKLGNKGPGPAKNVTITFQVPEGLEFVNLEVDNGTYAYDPETRTVTWTINDVPVGDPYLYLTVKALESGEIVITNYITSETYNTSSSTITVNINVLPASNGGNDSNNTANAATIPMQNTGTPLNYLVMAILMVITGLLVPKRKK